MTLFEEIKLLNIPFSNHYSDLYIPVNETTKALLKKYYLRAEAFNNQVEGGLWFDIFGAFDPFWNKLEK